MEVRCGSCNKLFRVSDDKITGAGIKFKCTRCSEYVKITKEEFESHRLGGAAMSALDSFAPKPKTASAPPVSGPLSPRAQKPAPPSAAGAPPRIDMVKPAPADKSLEQQIPSFLGTSGPSIEPDTDAMMVPEPTPAYEPPFAPARENAAAKASARLMPERETETAAPSPVETASLERLDISEKSLGVDRRAYDSIHPLVTGSVSGTLGGLGCSVPIITVMFLGLGALSALTSSYLPQQIAAMPVIYNIAVAVSGLMGLGIVIGIVLAMIQAATSVKIFSFPGVLIGTLLGAAIGALQGLAVSGGAGGLIGTGILIMNTARWGVTAIFLSIALVIARRVIVSSKRESFSAHLSAVQVLGLILFTVILGFGIYSEVMSATQMRLAKDQAAGAIQEVVSTEGLQITNPSGYMDSNSDLVVTGVVENMTDNERPVWLVTVDVFDAQNAVLIQARMLSGRQLYTQRDYEILARRGVNVQEMVMQNMQDKGVSIPPRGMVNFEIRVMEPPVGITSFNASLQKFDPMQMLKEAQEQLKQRQQQ